MGNMSIRNIPDEAHEALKARAKSNGRSAEAEVRAMIIETARQSNSGGFGSPHKALQGCGRRRAEY
ncbi:FitA-like ribbon-helix-helix domain-containing protein [Tritonibacter mobilis]|uniref:Antitoxin FitA-like ribbon-helix-helix domain-containing protein n=2 Tax=Tritonibacter mobilis TaxID=379347 RepID=A0A1B1A872_9RHOB|nr:hypothetical protein K529_018430 [Tritonibacter mobilis F1926]